MSPFRLCSGAFAALFVFAATLQLNDPDPARWIAMYLAAAVPCALTALGRPAWPLSAIVAATAFAWLATYIRAEQIDLRFPRLFEQWKMTDESVVAGRETYGLLIIAMWMIVLTIVGYRRRR